MDEPYAPDDAALKPEELSPEQIIRLAVAEAVIARITPVIDEPRRVRNLAATIIEVSDAVLYGKIPSPRDLE